MTPDAIIERLGLEPHLDGGFAAQTWGADREPAAATAMVQLLRAAERTRWVRLDADELWVFHAGSPLALDLAAVDRAAERVLLGPELGSSELPQRLVPAGLWRSAVPVGAWTLFGRVVAPGRTVAQVEIAPEGWMP